MNVLAPLLVAIGGLLLAMFLGWLAGKAQQADNRAWLRGEKKLPPIYLFGKPKDRDKG